MQQLQNPPRPTVRGIVRDHRDDAPLHQHPHGEEPEREPRWPWLVAGIAAAWLAQFVLPGNFTWFLAAFPHEMGHATLGCLFGRPSAPAVSLAGEAWAGIGDRRTWLVWTVASVCAIAAFAQREQRARGLLLGIAALAIPAIAFTSLSEVLIAAGGHLGEIAFAAFCYSLCWNGGYTGTVQERIASAMAGALLQANSLRLCFGLLTSDAARDLYATNGSLGMKNDMLVLAEDLCDCRLQAVALVFLVLSVLALPAGLLLGHWRRGAHAD